MFFYDCQESHHLQIHGDVPFVFQLIVLLHDDVHCPFTLNLVFCATARSSIISNFMTSFHSHFGCAAHAAVHASFALSLNAFCDYQDQLHHQIHDDVPFVIRLVVLLNDVVQFPFTLRGCSDNFMTISNLHFGGLCCSMALCISHLH